MDDLEFFRFYLVDLLVNTPVSFDEELDKVEEIMKQLQSAGLKCKIDKCKVVVPKVEYLGCIITKNSIISNPKKAEAIINLERPKNLKKMWGSS